MRRKGGDVMMMTEMVVLVAKGEARQPSPPDKNSIDFGLVKMADVSRSHAVGERWWLWRWLCGSDSTGSDFVWWVWVRDVTSSQLRFDSGSGQILEPQVLGQQKSKAVKHRISACVSVFGSEFGSGSTRSNPSQLGQHSQTESTELTRSVQLSGSTFRHDDLVAFSKLRHGWNRRTMWSQVLSGVHFLKDLAYLLPLCNEDTGLVTPML
ncbi:hypothetical protein HanIR_Chr17g0885661 [Helianthus annuus]|nr:hypothetical protein HanIR_Chr17g0885661 [Helianthus annuus]